LKINTDTSTAGSKHGRQRNKVVFWFWHSIENTNRTEMMIFSNERFLPIVVMATVNE
jgi:hypothetical protein